MEAPHCHCIKAHKLIPGVIPGITATFLPLSIVGLFKKKKKNHDIADADNANEEDPYKKLKRYSAAVCPNVHAVSTFASF